MGVGRPTPLSLHSPLPPGCTAYCLPVLIQPSSPGFVEDDVRLPSATRPQPLQPQREPMCGCRGCGLACGLACGLRFVVEREWGDGLYFDTDHTRCHSQPCCLSGCGV